VRRGTCRSGERGGVFEPIGEPLGALDRFVRPARRDGTGDPRQLSFDRSVEPSGGMPYQRVEPGDHEVEPLHLLGDGAAARGPVLVEADHLTHGTTVPPGSDTLQDPDGRAQLVFFARTFRSVRIVSSATIATIWPPRIIRFTSTAGRQTTSSPRITKAPSGLAFTP